MQDSTQDQRAIYEHSAGTDPIALTLPQGRKGDVCEDLLAENRRAGPGGRERLNEHQVSARVIVATRKHHLAHLARLKLDRIFQIATALPSIRPRTASQTPPQRRPIPREVQPVLGLRLTNGELLVLTCARSDDENWLTSSVHKLNQDRVVWGP
jgi:hypothetical protein